MDRGATGEHDREGQAAHACHCAWAVPRRQDRSQPGWDCVATIDGLLLVSCIKVRRVGAGTAGRDDPALLGLPSLPGRGQKPCPDRVPEGAAGRLDPKTICSVVWRAVTRLVATPWVGRDRVGPALRRRGPCSHGGVRLLSEPLSMPRVEVLMQERSSGSPALEASPADRRATPAGVLNGAPWVLDGSARTRGRQIGGGHGRYDAAEADRCLRAPVR